MPPDKSIICFCLGRVSSHHRWHGLDRHPPPWWENGPEQNRGPRHPRHRGAPNNGVGGAETRGEVPKTWGWSRGQCGGCCFFERWTFYIKGAHFGGLTFSRCVANSASNMFLYMLFDSLWFNFRVIEQIFTDFALLWGVVLNSNLLLSYFWVTFELLCDATGNLLLSYFWVTFGCRWNC